MRKYELLCLLKAGFDIENTDNIVNNVEKIIETFGGKVIDCNKIGRKRLAYEIAGNRDSFCVTFKMEMEPDKLKEFKRQLKLNDNILRNFVTVDTTKEKATVSA